MPIKKIFALLALFTGTLSLNMANSTSVSADTQDDVIKRGALRCGVNVGLAGFGQANSLGEFSGFDVDICRAVAAALFNDKNAVEMVPVTTEDRFIALESGALDILSRNTTWTLERNALFGQFVGITFYDGQGFMVNKSSGIRSALELDNQPLCIARNTTSDQNASDFFAISNMRYRPVYFSDTNEAIKGYAEGRCKSFSTDRSALAAQRSRLAEPQAHLVLPEVISKEPLGPVVSLNDPGWQNIVRWTLNCMINAEELGVSSRNVTDRNIGETPAIRRLLGIDGNSGQLLGLNRQWCKQIIQKVGNYGEVYERNIGLRTPIGLERGINELWTNGGLIYAPPMR